MFNLKYTNEQMCEFMEACGNKNNSVTFLDRMFSALLFVVANTRESVPCFEGVAINWTMRRPYFCMLTLR